VSIVAIEVTRGERPAMHAHRNQSTDATSSAKRTTQIHSPFERIEDGGLPIQNRHQIPAIVEVFVRRKSKITTPVVRRDNLLNPPPEIVVNEVHFVFRGCRRAAQARETRQAIL